MRLFFCVVCLVASFSACAEIPVGASHLDRKVCEVVGQVANLSSVSATPRTPLVVSGKFVLHCPCAIRMLSDSTDGRNFGGVAEARHLAGAVEERQITGEIEGRMLVGGAENRSLAGETEDRRLVGSTEQRRLAGTAEERALSGQSEPVACFENASCSGYWVTGTGTLSIFDGKTVTPLPGRCVP